MQRTDSLSQIMAKKTVAGVGDCSPLPFSRAEAERLRATAAAVEASPVITDGNRQLRLLPGRPILTWPIQLLPHDPMGISSAPEFVCWKKAAASKLGIAGAYFSRKAGGRTQCHSHLEEKLLRFFDMCPFVVEIRTQYPSLDFDKFEKTLRRNKRFRQVDVMTIDFMLTLQIPGYPFRVYHAVSGKPAALLSEPDVESRHSREAKQVSTWGCSHEVMTELSVSSLEHLNHRRLLSYMLRTRNIEDFVFPAARLARALMATTAKGPLDRVLTMVAHRQGWNQQMGYKIFGIAHFLGYLRWNHHHEVHRHKSMMLLK